MITSAPTRPKAETERNVGIELGHFIMDTHKLYIPDFEPKGHIYARPEDGLLMDSVTTIIKAECGLYQYGDGVAAERGTAVHRACHYYDDGDLDEATLPDNVKPYLEQYVKALSDLKIKILANELMRYHPTYLYAGTPDKLAIVDKNIGIIDVKTGQEGNDHAWQLAGYEALIKHEHPGKVLKRWNLYLLPDRYKFIERDGRNDFTEFIVLYSAHNLKIQKGFRKPRGIVGLDE